MTSAGRLAGAGEARQKLAAARAVHVLPESVCKAIEEADPIPTAKAHAASSAPVHRQRQELRGARVPRGVRALLQKEVAVARGPQLEPKVQRRNAGALLAAGLGIEDHASNRCFALSRRN